MKYSIKPFIYNTDKNLVLFFTEIHQMDLSQIKDGVDSCILVMNGEHEELWWGLVVSELAIHKETSTLTYNGDFVTEILTLEIYNMLKAYHDKLQDYENEMVG